MIPGAGTPVGIFDLPSWGRQLSPFRPLAVALSQFVAGPRLLPLFKLGCASSGKLLVTRRAPMPPASSESEIDAGYGARPLKIDPKQVDRWCSVS